MSTLVLSVEDDPANLGLSTGVGKPLDVSAFAAQVLGWAKVARVFLLPQTRFDRGRSAGYMPRCLPVVSTYELMKSFRILVADDEPADLYLLKQAFGEAGHAVIPCTDGTSALTAARKEKPDAIVADALMPGVDGFQLCQVARRDPLLCALPLILISATYTDREDESLAKRVDADLFLRKPDDMPQVVERVVRIVDQVRQAPPRPPLAAELDREVTEAHARRLATKMEAKIIELRAANEALHKSEDQVRKLNRRLEATIGELQAGIAERRRVTDMLNLAERVGRAGSWSVDLDTGITLCSPEAASILGLTQEAGKFDWEAVINAAIAPDRERARDILPRQSVGGGEFDFELALDLPVVGERIVHFRSEVFGNEDGGAGRRVGTIRDVTTERAAAQERHRLEQCLIQANKLESVGRLAAGIAHDFNNILAAIVSHAELIRLASEQPGEPEEADEATDVTDCTREILHAAFRTRDLIGQILTFTRQQKAERTPIQAGKVVEEALCLLRPSIPANVDVSLSIDPDCPAVLGNESQLHQVIINLCRNALQAMEATGGRLGVYLSPIQIDQEFSAAHAPLRPGAGLLLRISDTGMGIERDNLPNLFEPFFSTQGGHGGSGLGLAVVHGIVARHEGCIHVESTAGAGTIFSIWLPAVEARAGEVEKEQGDGGIGAGQRILVVDDEPSIATICARLLQRQGFQAEAVTDPLQARAKLLADPHSIDLLLTDYAMPGLNGVELSRAIWTVRPGLPVVLAAGYGEALTRESAMATGFRDLVAKPYSIETLMSVCTAALA